MVLSKVTGWGNGCYSVKHIKSLKLPVPPIQEQKRIHLIYMNLCDRIEQERIVYSKLKLKKKVSCKTY
ncbi:restriction endonuclease subunit S [Aliamphritea spongicola]